VAEATVAAPVAESKGPGLVARTIGVVFSPRSTYAAVAARPRALGVLLFTIVVVSASTSAFLATAPGQEALRDQMDTQIRMVESLGVTVSDEAYARAEQGLDRAVYTTPITQAIFVPILVAFMAVVFLVIFSMLMGGDATYRQVFAVVAHSGVITAVQVLFTMPLSYATARFATANLGVFVPMLEESSYIATFLSYIELFRLWGCINLAIGLGVLYKRRTGGIAMTLVGIYVVGAALLALLRSGS
jgi:hypothetical protein